MKTCAISLPLNLVNESELEIKMAISSKFSLFPIPVDKIICLGTITQFVDNEFMQVFYITESFYNEQTKQEQMPVHEMLQ